MSSNFNSSVSSSFLANEEICLVSMSFKICSRLLALSAGKFFTFNVVKFLSGSKVGLKSW